LSPDLFDHIDPPSIWITMPAPECDEAETRSVTIRIQERGRRSVSATQGVSRYAPEDTVVLALSMLLKELATNQVALDRDLLEERLRQSILCWVDPF
jgi:hypothetical protein